MKECISCGSLFLAGERCDECGSTLINALDREQAEKEYRTKLQHMGIELDDAAIHKLVDAALRH